MPTKLLQQRHSKRRAQAMVEFAIVLPILIVILIGIFEVGRMIFIYAAVTNASREAARFGSALGYDDQGYHKYRDCQGIKNIARRSAFFLPVNNTNITIAYDDPDNGTFSAVCDLTTAGEDPNVIVSSGDRVIITVNYDYTPLTRLMPFPTRTFTARSARTILGFIDIASAGNTPIGGSTPIGGGATSTPTATSAGAPTNTPTATATFTATETGAPVFTFTPGVTPTITLLPSNTPTPSITPTPTNTATPTATFTPTNTPTAVPGCGNITGNAISFSTNTMYMTFTNPYGPLTMLNVQVTWKGAAGANKFLTLESASLGGLFWTGTNSTGTATITPTSAVTIPGNNTTSAIIFTFDKNYSSISGTESIIIHLSTSGCTSFTIHSP